ncbi:hypothetical protein SNEBB_007471 [Seison nebaliae]|nr:hypothetical protein SNEBB_007471 [Seison nebaliae]
MEFTLVFLMWMTVACQSTKLYIGIIALNGATDINVLNRLQSEVLNDVNNHLERIQYSWTLHFTPVIYLNETFINNKYVLRMFLCHRLQRYPIISFINLVPDTSIPRIYASIPEFRLIPLMNVGNPSISLLQMFKYGSTINAPYVNYKLAKRPSLPSNIIDMLPELNDLVVELVRHFQWKKFHYIYGDHSGYYRLQQLLQLQINDTEFAFGMKKHGHHYQSTLTPSLADFQPFIPLQLEIEPHQIDASPTRGLESHSLSKTILRYIANNNISAIAPYKIVFLDFGYTKSATWKSIKDAFQKIKEMGVTGPHYHYVILSYCMNEYDLSSFRLSGLNITGFELVDKEINPEINLETALAGDAIYFLKQNLLRITKEEPKLFKGKTMISRHPLYEFRDEKCIRRTNDISELNEKLLNYLYGFSYVGQTGKLSYRASDGGKRNIYKLKIYRVAPTRTAIKVGEYERGGHLDLQEIPMRTKGNYTIENRTRIVTTLIGEPFVMIVNGTNGTKYEEYEGYCIDLLKELAKRIDNFYYIVRPAKDNQFGNRNSKGEWNGMIGELVRGEADLAIASLTITSEREQYVDFSKPFMQMGISIMIQKPAKKSPSVFSFMNPFSHDIWMCIIFAYVGVSVVIFLVSRFSPEEWRIDTIYTEVPTVCAPDGTATNATAYGLPTPNLTYQAIDFKAVNDLGITNSLWFSASAFMGQGVECSPKSVPGRIATSVWWFFILILISSYTANLAAFLTAERMVSPIEGAEDLAKQAKIQYGTLSGGSTQEFFRQSTSPLFQRMWTYMSTATPSVFVTSNEAGISRVRKSNGHYAFLIESVLNEYHNQREPCNTMKVGGDLDSKGYGIATPFGSDLRDPINIAVLELHEEGILAALKMKWWYRGSECKKHENAQTSSKDTSQHELLLPNVAGIFYILIAGLVIAIIIAFAEFCFKSRQEAKKEKIAFHEAVRSKIRRSFSASDNVSRHSQQHSICGNREGKDEKRDSIFCESSIVESFIAPMPPLPFVEKMEIMKEKEINNRFGDWEKVSEFSPPYPAEDLSNCKYQLPKLQLRKSKN